MISGGPAAQIFLRQTAHHLERATSMKIELTQAEAFVLHDLLYRISNGTTAIKDLAEYYVLWTMECQLEKELVIPDADNYDELMEKARDTVRRNY